MSTVKRIFSTSFRILLVLGTIVFSTWSFGKYLTSHTPHAAIQHQEWVQPELKRGKCAQCEAARMAALSNQYTQTQTLTQHDHSPMFQPNMNHTQLLAFATEAAMSAFTYSYNDYRRHFQQSSNYFTPTGWTNFITALRQSGNLSTVLDNKMLVKAVPTDAPIIITEGQASGIYTWRVQLPLLVVYRGSGSAKGAAKQNLVVTMHIRRSNIEENGRGVAIDELIAAPRKEQVA